ncbi:MAG TPA: CPBP family intramembrane glutamic endopeptidase [Polyangiales bacterium]|nr:CPBP family intramembrane glutamic endopeptidase [Polyangiales bacterium]
MIARVRALVRAIDEDRAGRDGAALACTVAALSLVSMEYLPERTLMRALYRVHPELHSADWAGLLDLAAWIGVRVLGFFALPALALWATGARVRDQALGPISARQLLPYAGLLALVLPCLALASLRPEFVRYYPFYRAAGRSWLDLAAWELLYALHFVALEFFFRGWWLTQLRPRFGSTAVYVAMVPYCMIHFTKPLLEVVAAIPAGIVLGLLAMQARSIWGGALLHVAVAWTMDALALVQSSGFPRQLTP